MLTGINVHNCAVPTCDLKVAQDLGNGTTSLHLEATVADFAHRCQLRETIDVKLFMPTEVARSLRDALNALDL